MGRDRYEDFYAELNSFSFGSIENVHIKRKQLLLEVHITKI